MYIRNIRRKQWQREHLRKMDQAVAGGATRVAAVVQQHVKQDKGEIDETTQMEITKAQAHTH